MKKFVVGLIAAGVATVAWAQAPGGYVPKDGFVPDAATAARIGEAVCIPIYGEAKCAAERPFKATLKDATWTVEGSLPAGTKGGVVAVEIAKADGKILKVSHGK
jgi:hypothetical protein